MNYWTALALALAALSWLLWCVVLVGGLYAWRRLRPTVQAMTNTASMLGSVSTIMEAETLSAGYPEVHVKRP